MKANHQNADDNVSSVEGAPNKHTLESIAWRKDFELQYVLLCKFCLRKIVDSDKTSVNQIYTKLPCPHCGLKKK